MPPLILGGGSSGRLPFTQAPTFISDTTGPFGDHRVGNAGPGGTSDGSIDFEALAAWLDRRGIGAAAPQAFGDTEAGFRAQLDLRNRQLVEDVRFNQAEIEQAKAELRSADARHAAEIKVRIRELEETLKFQREELAENQRQFDNSLVEEQRQFDERLGFDQSSLISSTFGTDPLRQAFAALGLDTSNLRTAQDNALDFGNGDPAAQTGGTAQQAAEAAGLGVSTALGLDPGSIGVSREQGVTGLPSAFKAATAAQQGGGAVRNLLSSAFGVGDKVSGGVNADEFTRRIEDVTPRGSLTF